MHETCPVSASTCTRNRIQHGAQRHRSSWQAEARGAHLAQAAASPAPPPAAPLRPTHAQPRRLGLAAPSLRLRSLPTALMCASLAAACSAARSVRSAPIGRGAPAPRGTHLARDREPAGHLFRRPLLAGIVRPRIHGTACTHSSESASRNEWTQKGRRAHRGRRARAGGRLAHAPFGAPAGPGSHRAPPGAAVVHSTARHDGRQPVHRLRTRDGRGARAADGGRLLGGGAARRARRRGRRRRRHVLRAAVRLFAAVRPQPPSLRAAAASSRSRRRSCRGCRCCPHVL